jgi:solute carrier family 25 citrate transporter 1
MLQDSPSGAMAIAGVVGGVFAASASHPFDTIKTRMQAYMYSKTEYMTWTSTASTIYQEGGVLNFWRGLLPRMTRIIGKRSGIIGGRAH